MPMYCKLTEHNSWEGETWYHYIYAGDTLDDREILNILQSVIDKHGDAIDIARNIELIDLSDEQITVLANIDGGYMQPHWFGESLDVDKLLSADSKSLYKGGIRDFAEDLFEWVPNDDNNNSPLDSEVDPE